MGILFMAMFFLLSIMLIGLILLQEGKGGGLTGMSAGMDGVMGAKNPLRRLTAWLFACFVVIAVGINWYFHIRTDASMPAGLDLSPIAPALPEPPATPEASEAPLNLPVPETETPAAPGTASETATGAENAAVPENRPIPIVPGPAETASPSESGGEEPR